MTNLNKHSFVNESRVARWFGEASLRQILEAAQGLRVPVPIAMTPKGGILYAVDGHLIGALAGGGFTSLSDLISEATTGGKRQDIMFVKTGNTGAVGSTNTLWRDGAVPGAGGAATALAAGDNLTRASTGAWAQANAAGGDTLHLTTWFSQATVVPNLLLLYDRIWEGLIAPSSLAVQTITHALLRYSSATLCPGNFAFIEAQNALGNFAHTWTLVYTDNDGNINQTTAAIAGIAACPVDRLDHAGFSLPLAAGDTGFQKFASIACNVNTVTGTQVIVAAHPIALIPQVVANQAVVLDGINSAFNLARVYDDACLALLELSKGATGATTYTGLATLVSG